MKDNRKSEFKVGAMVLVGFILFLVIYGWAKNLSIGSQDKKLSVRFENVSGLEIGDDVTINGMRKGFVEDMHVNNKDVLVKISLDPDVNLKQDAKFAVTMLDLMGGKKIEITPGLSNTGLNYNKVQDGMFYADIPQVMSMIGAVEGDLYTILMDVKSALHSLNQVLNDKQLNQDIKSSITNLKDVSQKLNIVIDENRSQIKLLTSNSVQLTQDAKDLIAQNKENVNKSVNELQKVLSKSNDILVSIESLLNETKNKENNAGKFLYDEEFMGDLKESLKEVKDLVKTLNDQIKGEGVKVDANLDIF